MNDIVIPLIIGLIVLGISGLGVLLFKHHEIGSVVATYAMIITLSVFVSIFIYYYGKMSGLLEVQQSIINSSAPIEPLKSIEKTQAAAISNGGNLMVASGVVVLTLLLLVKLSDLFEKHKRHIANNENEQTPQAPE